MSPEPMGTVSLALSSPTLSPPLYPGAPPSPLSAGSNTTLGLLLVASYEGFDPLTAWLALFVPPSQPREPPAGVPCVPPAGRPAGGKAKAAEAVATNIVAMSAATVANNKMRFIDTSPSSMERRKGVFGPPPC